MPVIGERELAAAFGCHRTGHVCGIEMLEIDEDRRVPRLHIRAGRDDLELVPDAGDLLAFGIDAGVADHDEPSRGAYFRQRHDLGRQFRADAGRIAHGQCDHRLLAVR